MSCLGKVVSLCLKTEKDWLWLQSLVSLEGSHRTGILVCGGLWQLLCTTGGST